MTALLIKYVVSPLIAAISSFLIKRYAEAKPKLITYLIHASAIPLSGIPDNPQVNTQVNSHSIVLRNIGRKTAHNLRIGHFVLPNFQLNPNVSYQILPNQNNGTELLIPTLVPNEEITISYLYFYPLVWSVINSYTKSDEGLAKYVNVVPTIKPQRWVVFVLWVLIIIGASTLISLLIFEIMRFFGLG